jgi:hypothetical protein
VLKGTSGAQPVMSLVLTLHDLLVGAGGSDSGQSLIGACAKAKCVFLSN